MTQIPFIISGTVNNSNGIASSLAIVLITNTTTSSAPALVKADSNGAYNHDLADTGYTAGDVIQVIGKDVSNNETVTEEFTVSGQNKTLNLNLVARTGVIWPSGNRGIAIHNIGGEPVSEDNPLPVSIINSADIIDLVNNPEIEWGYNSNAFSPDTQTVTIKGESFRRTFTKDSRGRTTKRSKWERI